MIKKEYFKHNASFDEEAAEYVLSIYSSLFGKDVEMRVIPEKPEAVNEKDGISDKIIAMLNDLIALPSSQIDLVKETAWKSFNRYGELVSYTLIEDEKYENGLMSLEKFQALNKKRQQYLFEIHSNEDC